MEFEAHRPIYLQIVDYLGNRILPATSSPANAHPRRATWRAFSR